jgi:hypothetical protein
VKGNFHARFWSRGGGSDSLVDCNRTGEQRWCVAWWSNQQSRVGQPPPLSVSVAMTSDVKSGPQLFEVCLIDVLLRAWAAAEPVRSDG